MAPILPPTEGVTTPPEPCSCDGHKLGMPDMCDNDPKNWDVEDREHRECTFGCPEVDELCSCDWADDEHWRHEHSPASNCAHTEKGCDA